MTSEEMAKSKLDDLAIALRAVVTGESMAHFFEAGTMRLPNGQKWRVTVGVFCEPAAFVAEGVIEALKNAGVAYQKLTVEPSK